MPVIENPVTSIIKSGLEAVKLFHDPKAKRAHVESLEKLANEHSIKVEELELERRKLDAEIETKAQTQEYEVTKEAMRHRSWWVAGARPAMVWVSVLAGLMGYVICPFLQGFGLEGFADAGTHIRENEGALMTLVTGSSITAIARSYDKARGSTHR